MSHLKFAHQLWAAADAFVKTEQPQVRMFLMSPVVMVCSPSLDSLISLHSIVADGEAKIYQCPEERCSYGIAFTASTWKRMRMFGLKLKDDWGVPELHNALPMEDEDLRHLMPLAYLRQIILREHQFPSLSAGIWEQKHFVSSPIGSDQILGERWLRLWQQRQRSAVLNFVALNNVRDAKLVEPPVKFNRKYDVKPVHYAMGYDDGKSPKRWL